MEYELCGEPSSHEAHNYPDGEFVKRCPGLFTEEDDPEEATEEDWRNLSPQIPQKFTVKPCGQTSPHGVHNYDAGTWGRKQCPGVGVVDLQGEIFEVIGGWKQQTEESETHPDSRHGLTSQGKKGGKTTAIAKWADKAMFQAEPIDATEGPKVYLLWMTPDPLGAIAAACKMYKGEVVRSLSDVSHEERLEYLQQIQKTKLKAPFEFVKFHFMIEGVTRAFTHQMVRQRTAVYAQESLRFAVKEDMPVGLPPSLAGTEDYWAAQDMPDVPETNGERMRNVWEAETQNIREAYLQLINMGMPAEDARGLLPHNVLTRLHYSTDLRALQDHAGNRLCTQAQFEWRLVWAQISKAIREYRPHAAMLDSLPDDMYNVERTMLESLDASDAWQYEALADVFKPVCYLTGKCEFKANFDRACSIRERVDANEAIGRPSSEWDKPIVTGPADEGIPEIKPGEWLLDPGAARKKRQP